MKKNTIKKYLSIALISILFAGAAYAGPEEGVKALKSGDYATAMREFQPLAEQGNAQAQYYVGRFYLEGLGVAKDEAKGVNLISKAAEQANPDAQHVLGVMYMNGIGVPENKQLAEVWLTKAAEQGMMEAQRTLGTVFSNSLLGFTPDAAKAAKWYGKAAEQGDSDSEYSLAMLYAAGAGVPQSWDLAVEWLHKAAQHDDNLARMELGEMYEVGNGVPANGVLAYFYYAIWGEQGKKDCEIVEKTLTPEQLAEAKNMAAEWKPGMPFPTKSNTWK